MLPLINGKDFMECYLEDFQVILDNSDYRENEHIDYKQKFAFLEMEKGSKRDADVAEFRSDVCAFANSDGGYLIYGVSEVGGIARKFIGIDIPDDNIDKFELDRNNNLHSIMPRVPPVQFKFLKLETGKYIVIIYVQHDFYAPYIHLENEANYRIYRRVGNGKKSASYMEIKNMFTQSLFLEKEIENFRRERIQFFSQQEDTLDRRYSKFLLFHVIPETFQNNVYNKNLFILKKQSDIQFGTVFSAARCNGYILPNVDGIKSIGTDGRAECLMFNNGTTELFLPLENSDLFDWNEKNCPQGVLYYEDIFGLLGGYIDAYFSLFPQIFEAKRYFAGISIIGCKGASSNPEFSVRPPTVDRNMIICPPITFTEDKNERDKSKAAFELNMALALGIRDKNVIDPLLSTVYPN